MFIAIVDVKIKSDKVNDFKNWFSESNEIISKFDGFVSRRLLETKDGQHRVLVEFDSMELFQKMHQSIEHKQVHSVGTSFMTDMPSPTFYSVVSQ